jgi:glutathione S-transferase
MTDQIVFYHIPQSRASMAHLMLEECGADYRIEPIDFSKGENRTPEFLAVNPMGKLPTIVHKGVVVTETPAIIAYLADLYPEAKLAPPIGDPARGTYYRWLFFGGSCFEPALLDKSMNRPEPQRSTAGYGSYEDVLNALKTALTPGPWLLGERFSAADVYVGSEINWAMMFGAPGLKGEPVFEDYAARLTARPAYKKVTGQAVPA